MTTVTLSHPSIPESWTPLVEAAEDDRPRRLYTFGKFAARHRDFITEPALRNLYFHRAANGFNACTLRRGRRVYIDEDAFFIWLESQQ